MSSFADVVSWQSSLLALRVDLRVVRWFQRGSLLMLAASFRVPPPNRGLAGTCVDMAYVRTFGNEPSILSYIMASEEGLEPVPKAPEEILESLERPFEGRILTLIPPFAFLI